MNRRKPIRSGSHYPDRKGGDETKAKALNRVYEILSDDGDKLGSEHSRRVHYDRVSSLDDFFDGQIELHGERTERLS